MQSLIFFTTAFYVNQLRGVKNRLRQELSQLKGHSQLMHMRIRYHFLADLHVTRRERETESDKRIRNTQNKPC